MSRHSASGRQWQAQRLRVLARDGWACAYCSADLVDGDKTHPRGATVDHVSAIALDPDHSYSDDELIAACRTCNGLKSDRPLVRLTWENPRWFGGENGSRFSEKETRDPASLFDYPGTTLKYLAGG